MTQSILNYSHKRWMGFLSAKGKKIQHFIQLLDWSIFWRVILFQFLTLKAKCVYFQAFISTKIYVKHRKLKHTTQYKLKDSSVIRYSLISAFLCLLPYLKFQLLIQMSILFICKIEKGKQMSKRKHKWTQSSVWRQE